MDHFLDAPTAGCCLTKYRSTARSTASIVFSAYACISGDIGISSISPRIIGFFATVKSCRRLRITTDSDTPSCLARAAAERWRRGSRRMVMAEEFMVVWMMGDKGKNRCYFALAHR